MKKIITIFIVALGVVVLQTQNIQAAKKYTSAEVQKMASSAQRAITKIQQIVDKVKGNIDASRQGLPQSLNKLGGQIKALKTGLVADISEALLETADINNKVFMEEWISGILEINKEGASVDRTLQAAGIVNPG